MAVFGGNRFGLAVLLGVFSACALACSSSEPPSGAASGTVTSEIQGGQTDSGHPFAVGVCSGTKGSCFGLCSGALITPNLVVTARHCVDDSPETIDCKTANFGGLRAAVSNFSITTSKQMIGQTTQGWHGVKKIVTPTPTAVCGNDIALLILSDKVAAAEATPIAPGIQYDLTDKRPYNAFDGFTAVGYGITGPSGNDSGTRRIRTGIKMICVPGDKTRDCFKLGLPPDQGSVNEFIGGDGTCSGDSGSSAYANQLFANGTFVSMGVLSRGSVSQDGTQCVGSVYTRLDSWRQLIVDTAIEASANWTAYPEPAWTTYVPPVPEPPSTAGTKALGDTCAADAECTTGNCTAKEGSAFVCTQACDPADAASCPDGFTCDDASSLCFAGAPDETTPTTTPKGDDDDSSSSDDDDTSSKKKKNSADSSGEDASSGCSVTTDPTKPVPWKGLGAFAAVCAVALVRRRRR